MFIGGRREQPAGSTWVLAAQSKLSRRQQQQRAAQHAARAAWQPAESFFLPRSSTYTGAAGGVGRERPGQRGVPAARQPGGSVSTRCQVLSECVLNEWVKVTSAQQLAELLLLPPLPQGDCEARPALSWGSSAVVRFAVSLMRQALAESFTHYLI